MSHQLDTIIFVVAWIAAAIILFNSFDDLFIDIVYFMRGLGRSRHRDLTVQSLRDLTQQRAAIMVPAWQEAPVIASMLENTITTLDYDAANYDIFVGTYANDPETQAQVDALADRIAQVHKVVVPHDGPTSKADCLNWIYQGIVQTEQARGVRFDFLVMHDAEDVVHPLALRLYNALIPQHDFVQTPVLPLEVPHTAWVGGTYMDEFVEQHLKDLLVRGSIGGLVPSAGVGSAFARDAFEAIALADRQQAFDPASLTEDYDIGLKFRLAGRDTYFAAHAIARDDVGADHGELADGDGAGEAAERGDGPRHEFIATREYFPIKFWNAVRQRSRWILGITLQEWAKMGWKGDRAVIYTLFRDRKALLIHVGVFLGYVAFAYALVRMAIAWWTGAAWSIAQIIPPTSLLWWVVWINLGFLTWRAVMKFKVVRRIYGAKHALLSFPRFVVGNVINFFAAVLAVRQFVASKITGEPLRWIKTDHDYPSAAALAVFRRKLGRLLVDREGLSRAHIQAALAVQRNSGVRLGDVLLAEGELSERQLARTLGAQHAMDVLQLADHTLVDTLVSRVPEALAAKMGVLPVSVDADGAVRVATSRPLSEAERRELETLLAAPVRTSIAAADTIAERRERMWRQMRLGDTAVPHARLGARLVATGVLTSEELDEALARQRATEQHLGELLVAEGRISPEELTRVASGQLHDGFVAVTPADVDETALESLGYGVCALNTLVPMRRDQQLEIASAHPVHRDVRRRLRDRLGVQVPFRLAPELDVRLALAVVSRKVWPTHRLVGSPTMDGAELALLHSELNWSSDRCNALAATSRVRNLAPLDCLLTEGRVTATEVARLRALSLGLDPDTAVVGGTDLPTEATDWLPPRMAHEDVQLISAEVGALVVTSPRPTPALARRVARMFPDRAIRWCVTPMAPDTSAAPRLSGRRAS
ncbi:MAG: glycosyl transferase family protein [Myxococcales bacterium]|nr:glycosyl transferase family protein [Myxococcales bacterium]